jgi:M6 family metalloprotease-like protein
MKILSFKFTQTRLIFILIIIILGIQLPSFVSAAGQEQSSLQTSSPEELSEIDSDPLTFETLEGGLFIIWDEQGNLNQSPTYFLMTISRDFIELAFRPDHNIGQKINTLITKQVLVTGGWDSSNSVFLVEKIEEKQTADLDPEFFHQTTTPWQIDGSKITGNTPWVTVLCKFPDIPDEPFDITYYQDMYGSDYPELNHYWREASTNAINLDGSTVAGWYTLPYNSDSPEYTTGATLGMVRDHCIAAADDDVDFSQFYGINVMFNHNIWPFFAVGGCGTYLLEGVYRHAGFTTTFPGNGGGLGNLVHEMGHGYCLDHSFINEGDQAYSNVWDVMSSSYTSTHPYWGYIPQHTIALNKNNLGWIDESKILTVQIPFDQTFSLARTAQPLTEDYQMVKIILDEGTYYTLETRQTSIPYDSQLPATAVIIHKYNAEINKISLITEGGSLGSSFPTAYWTVGETYNDPDFGLTFTVTGATDTGFTIDLSFDEMTPFAGCSDQTSIPVTECEVLVALYEDLNGPNWIGPRGWLVHPDPCMWTGVTCSDGNVTEILLLTEYLTGALPSSFGTLSKLRSLWIEGNLTGPIPPEMGNLSQLEKLNFKSNQLTGEIPPELGNLSNLTSLDLYGNRLTGSIPAEFGNLDLLTYLRVSGNQLTGNLPSELGDMDSLISISIDGNPVHGLIPLSLTQLEDMHSFSFRNTYLCEPTDTSYWEWVATMPVENYSNDGVVCLTEAPFTSCTAQSSISVTECDALVSLYNNLDGPGWDKSLNWLVNANPCTWGGVTCNGGFVTGLHLTTALAGTIPASIGDLGHLTLLHLDSESLSGPIPAILGELGQLESLVLKGNLTQSIPKELSYLSHLEVLNLQGNQLTGVIPSELGGLNFLTHLDLSDNQLGGFFPMNLVWSGSLEILDLSKNNYSGSLPDLSPMVNLVSIILDDNAFFGSIPESITELRNIRTFSFRNTNLCEPSSVEFQIWKEQTLDDWFNDGVVCVPGIQLFIPLIVK